MALVTPVAPVPESNRVKALKRFAKVAGAALVAAAASWAAGPDFANVVGTQYAVVLFAVLTPVLSALQKALTEQNVDPK